MESRAIEQWHPFIHGFLADIAFNNMLGIKPHEITWDKVVLKLPWQDSLVGNPAQKTLHGGVVSSILDVTGGTMAVLGVLARIEDANDQAMLRDRLATFGTIDLRVDYLRPGRGEAFYASAMLLRAGNKVAVTRMEFHNEQDELLAVGTGTYLCG